MFEEFYKTGQTKCCEGNKTNQKITLQNFNVVVKVVINNVIVHVEKQFVYKGSDIF